MCQAVCDPVQDSEDQEYNSKKCSIAKLQQIYEDKLDQRKKNPKNLTIHRRDITRRDKAKREDTIQGKGTGNRCKDS